MLRLLIVVAPLVEEHGLENTLASVAAAQELSGCGSWTLEHRLCSCGIQTLLSHGVQDLPRPGSKPWSISYPLYHQGSPGCSIY